ncbi:MAG: hypothetical protein K2K81_10270 [Muribaculaceae bacterium]|nr:hypothetical protein [Muribaculaceae bacterium]
MYVPPKNDPEHSQKRLDAIMGRQRLKFNPYSVSDSRLLEIANNTGWGNELDITQIVTIHFTHLRETGDFRKFDGIFMCVGNEPEEIFISSETLKRGVTANDTVRIERSLVGNRPIRNDRDIECLEGKTFFVSRIIRGVNIFGSYKGAYRMHRLSGKVTKDASIIRKAMCEAKIEMLERILAYPESPDYLSCTKGFFDYETRIRQAIELIRRFPESTTFL